ncbi:MAG: N-acetylneuraminate lyase [Spirochaetia bacterium]|nr:N-acetylneuraminate lyase [Spirochaetia bacterium]
MVAQGNDPVLSGIYAAAITPMHDDGSINERSLREYTRWELEHGAEGLYVCGSSGEGLLLSLSERKKVLEIVLDTVAGTIPVIAHTGTIRTADAVELTRHAKDAGAVAASMIPPYYYSFKIEEIIDYYTDVMRAVDLPLIIYNIPAFTGTAFTVRNCSALLKEPQLAGIKHTSMNLYDLERMKKNFPDKTYFNGYDEVFLSGLAAGADSAIGTTVNIFPEVFKEIRQSFQNGDMEKASLFQHKVNDLVELFVDMGIFNAVKYVFTLRGIPCGSCRKPFKPLSELQKSTIKQYIASM